MENKSHEEKTLGEKTEERIRQITEQAKEMSRSREDSPSKNQKNTDSPKAKNFRGNTSRAGGKSSSRPKGSKNYTQPETRHIISSTKVTSHIAPPGDNIRIIPLGGVEEVGRNMTLIEYKDTIIVVDIGIQFTDSNTPGIDFILPNTKYLEERKDKIKAVVITHGHLDHIGGIPYIMPRIGNPPLYSRLLTTVMIKKRQEEFPHQAPLLINVVEKNSVVTLGDVKLKFFAVTHTIPDAMGVMIESSYGSIVLTGDLKLEHKDGKPADHEEVEFSKFKDENVLLLMADSTNVEKPGWSIPESEVIKNIEDIITNVEGRLVIGLFASLLERIMAIIEIAEKQNKKVIVEGRSLKNNIEIVKSLNMVKTKSSTIIGIEEMDNYPPDRIIILATGAQGDDYTALVRMATKTHKYVKIGERDTILLSASVVPGNEKSVQRLKDNLSRQGAHLITYQTSDVHSSGHANRDETAWIHRKINSKFFVPVHGYHYMLRVHGDIAESLGSPKENVIIPDNGMIIEIQDGGKKIVKLKDFAPKTPIMVDGNSVGDMQDVVIRDRQLLAQDGMFIILAVIDSKTGKLKKSPDLISRGFVYLKESQDLLREARILIKKTIEDTTLGQTPLNVEYAKGIVAETLSKFLLQKTHKRPVVIPVILDF
jgi:ribonuclease J